VEIETKNEKTKERTHQLNLSHICNEFEKLGLIEKRNLNFILNHFNV
jgi:hypothetical protein